ncbi:MAG: ATP-binding protein, partial [Candidatus Eremiobacteraeota bacterium]|nr:ATP-binding protein [Candidatus Eremiobacteraeota bacterium]
MRVRGSSRSTGIRSSRFGCLAHDDGSTGLGLYLCKQLVGLMKGTIAFDSDPGRRTSFWLRLLGRLSDGLG